MPSFVISKVGQSNPLGPSSSSDLYNAHSISTPKVELQNESSQRYDTENQMYVCSPIQEKDSEGQLGELHTPIGTNPNYVTPQATGKNSRRINAIGTNAPQQLHHEP